MRAAAGVLLAVGFGALLLGGSGVLPNSGPEDPNGLEGSETLAAKCTTTAPDTAGTPMNGVSLVSPRSPLDPSALDALERIGADWVAVLPYGRLADDGTIAFGRSGFSSGRLDLVEGTIEAVHDAGFRVMLKPHLWAGRDWVGEFAPETDQGWDRFEAEYRRFIMAFAELAAAHEVEILVIGTELDRTVRERPELWAGIIRDIRAVYDGGLTYAANWDGVADVPFWPALDYIGVDAFYPLSRAATPEPEALERAWRPIVEELATLCRENARPVLFTEFGYRSIDGSAGEQWGMPREGDPGTPVNLRAQVNAYDALFRVWWERPWMAGGFLWKWFPDDDAFAARTLADYTPQHKPVEALIRRWYRSATARPSSEAAEPVSRRHRARSDPRGGAPATGPADVERAPEGPAARSR